MKKLVTAYYLHGGRNTFSATDEELRRLKTALIATDRDLVHFKAGNLEVIINKAHLTHLLIE